MNQLLETFEKAKRDILKNKGNCFEAANALAVVSAHLQDFKSDHPQRDSDVNRCLSIIDGIAPEISTTGSISAAVIALEGRIKALLHD